MRRLASILATCLTALACTAPAAQAAFGLHGFDVAFTEADGATATQAGSHPFAMTTTLGINAFEEEFEGEEHLFTEGRIKDISLEQIPGFVGDPTAYPRCSSLQFLQDAACPIETQVGVTAVSTEVLRWRTSPVFNLTPPPGVLARIGWSVASEANIVIDVGLTPAPPYSVLATSRNTPQVISPIGVKAQLWGDPTDPGHDPLRGSCLKDPPEDFPLDDPADFQFESNGPSPACSVTPNPKPFLTLPTFCGEPLPSSYRVSSWEGELDAGSVLTHDAEGNPRSLTGCGALPPFDPSIAAAPTAKAATSPTGLDFSLEIEDEGLTSPNGRAKSQIRKAVVTLPEGMSVNPSQAEGLEVCSEEDLENETLQAAPGEGCPQASKIGTIEVESPLLPDKLLKGSLYIAKPYENPFNSLLALYIVIKNPELGISVTQAAKVIPDPVTGQLTTVTEEMPQLPFSHFRLHFKEGTRSPLATPPTCGTHEVKALLYPWSGGAPVESTSAFEVISGPGGGPCPKGGLPPFKPGLVAGTINNRAGSFSPFNLRLFRSDSEQEITHFSIKLPPGIVGKLAGIPFCPDAAIAAAKARTGPHGGAEELTSPSCPQASEIGRTLAGAGVGPSLTYAPGKVYLAGPYHGSPLSMVAITAGVVGPFDIGTVVIREAFKINPETAEVFVDATGSDPIPHIIQGIPVHLRDIRAYVDKPNFVLNPTSCARTSTASTVLGSGLDFVSEADDNPITVSSPFQAADCASLGFKPKLALKLTGATKRGANPALRATLIPRPGDANSRSISVQLPHSEFLDQAHIRTVCTRVQFNAGAGNGAGCPAGSVYGHARAWTPLLSEPLEGPVFLRSSEHPLPDLVLAMHGLIDFNAVGRVDSVDGGIRNTFDFVPDAPVAKVVVDFEGGAKGLLENSTNLCKSKNRAIAKFQGHNGKAFNAKPLLKVKCKKHKKGKKAKAHKRHARAAR